MAVFDEITTIRPPSLMFLAASCIVKNVPLVLTSETWSYWGFGVLDKAGVDQLDGGIGNHNVQAAELIDRLSVEPIQVGESGNVSSQRDGSPADSFEVFNHRTSTALVGYIVDHHVCAFDR